MQEVQNLQDGVIIRERNKPDLNAGSWKSYLPVILAVVGAFLMLGLRIEIGPRFVSDGALMMVALACYILAALFQLTNLYAPSEMAQKIAFLERRTRRFL